MDNNRSNDYKIDYKIPGLLLLQTDETEPELLFKNMLDDPDVKNPEHRKPCVFFRMRYEDPLQPFTGIRKLILAIRRKMGLRSGFRGPVGIDVSAWKGHEEEEYFQILLKYLYDNSREWNLTFICSNYTRQEFLHLQYHCVNYFMIESRQVRLYPEGILESSIRRTFTDLRHEIEPEAVNILAAAIRSCSAHISGLPQKLPRIAREVLRLSETGEEIFTSGTPVSGGEIFTQGTPVFSESYSGIGEQRYEQHRNSAVSAKMISSYVDNPSGLIGLLRNMTDFTSCTA